jgi:hypothetical protein
MSEPAQTPQQVQLQYVDRPEVSETYADSLEKAMFDGNSIKMEFVVNRLNPPVVSKPPGGKKVTSSRLVMPLAGIIQMVSQLKDIMASLEQQGIIKTTPIAPSTNTKN